MCEKGVEEDTDALAAGGDTECVEYDDEKQLSGAWKADSENRKDAENEGCDDFERYFISKIGDEEGSYAVSAVVVFFVEDVALEGIDAHVLQHSDKDHLDY